jgi:chromosome partitioning protein
MKTISFINDKGGVGKTASSVNTAAVLGKKGKKVLVMDLDRQANATEYLGIAPELTSGAHACLTQKCTAEDLLSYIKKTSFEGVSIISAGEDLESAEIQIAMDIKLPRETRIKRICDIIASLNLFDFVLIDCPPSLHAVAVNAMVAADFIVIPVQISQFAIAGIGTVFNHISEIQQNFNPNIESGILLTLYENTAVMREVAKYFEEKNLPIFNTRIRKTTKFIESTLDHTPIVYYSPSSTAATDYQQFTDELLERVM